VYYLNATESSEVVFIVQQQIASAERPKRSDAVIAKMTAERPKRSDAVIAKMTAERPKRSDAAIARVPA
jgi:hypothetical protein